MALLLALAGAPRVTAQTTRHVTSPREQFGFDIGADYQLVDYAGLDAYWRRLARESDRVVLRDIGRTAEGRTQWVAILSAPENLARLERYRTIAERLARARDLDPDSARLLAEEGRAVVLIDGGLHGTEVLGSQQLIEMAYQLAGRQDEETRRILRDVIVLLLPANPDGMQLAAEWYARDSVPERRTLTGLPRLYQRYAGHDTNRDFYLSSQPETKNINRLMYRSWYPQIVYDHHQSGPPGTVMFSPPFRDPFNYHIDPLVIEGIDLVSAALHTRLLAEGLPGFTMRSGSSYSAWWNGGLRTAAYFHNMIGILTETIGSPTPISIPFVPQQQLPAGDRPAPIEPHAVWHFSQSLRYVLAANYAVLDLAARYRTPLLLDAYRMGRRAIERGSADAWTASPRRVEAAVAALTAGDTAAGLRAAPGHEPDTLPLARFDSLLRRPADRDPRGYILPADQPDFGTATRFVNALLDNGVEVLRATSPFRVAGRHYPAGSYVIRTRQAFRAHVLDMFEPQEHPDDVPYPGAAPTPPYDNAGYTLALQMGVRFDRVLDAFDGPFEAIAGTDIRPPAGRLLSAGRLDRARGFYFAHAPNDAFVVVNRLLAAGLPAYWLTEPRRERGTTLPAGTFYVPARPGVLPILERAAREDGLEFRATSGPPRRAARLRSVRLALWDRYGGSRASGWTRWVLEQFEFPYRLVYPPELDRGDLRARFDVLVLPTDALPERDGARGDPGARARPGAEPAAASLPDSLRARLGRIGPATIPPLRAFLEQGGTIVAVGGATAIARRLGLPVEDALAEPFADSAAAEPVADSTVAERSADSAGARPLGSDRFFVPGSILTVRVDTTSPLTAGMSDPVDVFFDHSPAFRLGSGPGAADLRPLAWFDSDHPLRSGWAWGQEHLAHTLQAIDAPVGRGHLYLFAPEINFRGQPYGTFKLLFNAIVWSAALPEPVK